MNWLLKTLLLAVAIVCIISYPLQVCAFVAVVYFVSKHV
jgi:hypothetical protein